MIKLHSSVEKVPWLRKELKEWEANLVLKEWEANLFFQKSQKLIDRNIERITNKFVYYIAKSNMCMHTQSSYHLLLDFIHGENYVIYQL